MSANRTAARRTSCPSCGAPLGASTVDATLGLARCGSCSGVFDLDASGPHGAASARTSGTPRGFRVERDAGGLTIRWTRRSFGLVFVWLFSLVWGAVGVYEVATQLGSGPTEPTTDSAAGAAAFYLVTFGFPLAITYLLVARTLNAQVLRVAGRAITVSQGPVPWPGRKLIDVSDVDQLFAETHAGDDSPDTHALMARLRDGRRVAVASGFEFAAHALFLEREVERALGRQHRHVPGEIPR